MNIVIKLLSQFSNKHKKWVASQFSSCGPAPLPLQFFCCTFLIFLFSRNHFKNIS